MLKKALLLKLYSYNMHIGSLKNSNSRLNYYVIGKRYNYTIINLNKTFILLKKVLFFLNNLSSNNGSLLFNYEWYNKLHIMYKCVLLSISKRSSQQMITYNWLYGNIGNFYFSFYRLIKEITAVWVKRKNYLFNSDKKVNRHSTEVFEEEANSFEKFEFLFYNTKNKKGGQARTYLESLKLLEQKDYKKWYLNWVKHTNELYKFWTFKRKATKETTLFRKMCFNNINTIWKQKKVHSFKYLFLKMFYFIYLKKKDPFIFEESIDKEIESINTNVVYKLFQKYWRFILYFKYFNNFYTLPDALFTMFPNKNNLPAIEYSTAGLVSIGVLDTDCDLKGINYPLISNDDSLVIVLFYFTLFSNIFLINQLNIYNIYNYNN